MNAFLSLLVILFFLGCGSEDGSLSLENSLELNTEDAIYSFIYSDLEFSCSDGSTGESPSGAMQMKINVDEGFIDINQTVKSATGGIERAEVFGASITESTSVSGPIDYSDGSFKAQGAGSFESEDYGEMDIIYEIDGFLTNNNWHGTYTFTIYLLDLNSSCEYSAPFSGKIQSTDDEEEMKSTKETTSSKTVEKDEQLTNKNDDLDSIEISEELDELTFSMTDESINIDEKFVIKSNYEIENVTCKIIDGTNHETDQSIDGKRVECEANGDEIIIDPLNFPGTVFFLISGKDIHGRSFEYGEYDSKLGASGRLLGFTVVSPIISYDDYDNLSAWYHLDEEYEGFRYCLPLIYLDPDITNSKQSNAKIHYKINGSKWELPEEINGIYAKYFSQSFSGDLCFSQPIGETTLEIAAIYDSNISTILEVKMFFNQPDIESSFITSDNKINMGSGNKTLFRYTWE